MSLHQDQVASVIGRALQTIIARGLNDPRVRGLVTVTRVDVSKDLGNATVFVSVMPEEHEELTVHGLRHAARHLRTEVGNTVRIRRMPHLTIKLDRSLKKQAAIHRAIDQARPNPDGSHPSEDAES